MLKRTLLTAAFCLGIAGSAHADSLHGAQLKPGARTTTLERLEAIDHRGRSALAQELFSGSPYGKPMEALANIAGIPSKNRDGSWNGAWTPANTRQAYDAVQKHFQGGAATQPSGTVSLDEMVRQAPSEPSAQASDIVFTVGASPGGGSRQASQSTGSLVELLRTRAQGASCEDKLACAPAAAPEPKDISPSNPQPTQQKGAKPEKLSFDGLLGMDMTFAGDEWNATPVGQGLLTYAAAENSARLGFSLRPHRNADGSFDLARPFVTTGAFSYKERGRELQVGIPDLLLGNTAYNTVGRYPCGCSGNSPPDKAASMAGMYVGSNLIETNGLGIATRYSKDDAAVTIGAMAAWQSDLFEKGEGVGYASAHHDAGTKTRWLANAALSEERQSYNLGVQQWTMKGKLQLRMNLGSTHEGGEGRQRLDALALYYPNPTNTLSLGASVGAYDDAAGSGLHLNWTRLVGDDAVLNFRAGTDWGMNPGASVSLLYNF